MKEREPQLSLEDLARLVDGDIGEDVQQRLKTVLRTDPRYAAQFAALDGLAAEAGTDDLWQAYIRHQEFDRLLAAKEPWKDPAEVLDSGQLAFFRVDYRQLLAIADSRLRAGEDPEPLQALRDRLLQAEREPARQAVFMVAEALEYLSEQTADKVVAEVRKKFLRQPD